LSTLWKMIMTSRWRKHSLIKRKAGARLLFVFGLQALSALDLTQAAHGENGTGILKRSCSLLSSFFFGGVRADMRNKGRQKGFSVYGAHNTNNNIFVQIAIAIKVHMR